MPTSSESAKAERDKLINDLKPYNVKLLAEKVETLEEHADALGKGFSYFQGYFFCKPVIVEGQDVAGLKLHYMQLLQELYKPEIDFDRLESLIKQDLSLSYKLLRFINSAAFQIRIPIRSIRQAMTLLGQKEMKMWASLITLKSMGYDQSDELIITALSRARFCEALALRTDLKERSTDLFLTGLFSFLDVFLNQPMETAIRQLPLDDDITTALLGETSMFRDIFDLVTCYEKGRWPKVHELANKLKLTENDLFSSYIFHRPLRIPGGLKN